jgi:O-succinylbenzoic acid--CoA ligase
MAWIRAALTGGHYVAWDWKRLEKGEYPSARAAEADPTCRGRRGEGWYLSLVPTQLQRLLFRPEPARSIAVRWLRSFDAVFLGGGPPWTELTDAAQEAGVPLSLSYGMTETAAMAAAQRPEEFLAGQRSSGSPLPHVQIEITAEGLVRLRGDSIFRGYHPSTSEAREFTTEDLGSLDVRGSLSIRGRRDSVIITGGEKVDPAEVEAALWATGEFSDVAVIALPDSEWGHTVAACFPAGGREPNLSRVEPGLRALTAYKRPRKFFALPDWPRNAQGKLNRSELVRRVTAFPKDSGGP